MKDKIINFIVNNYIIFCIYAFIGWIYEVSWFLIVKNKFVNRGVLFGPFLPIYGFGILILLLCLKNFLKKKHYSSNLIYTSVSMFTIVTFIATTIIEYTHDKIYRVDMFFNKYGMLLIILNISAIILGILLVKLFKIKDIDTSIVLTFLLIWIITTVVEYVGHYIIDVNFNKLLWDYSKDFLNINSRVNWDASRNFAIGGTLCIYLIQPLIDKFLNSSNLKTRIIICLIIGIPMLIDFIL